MGNVIESFASGFGKAVGKLFNSPVEFLSGKSCSSVCGPGWDLVCYIEHFCVANLLKLALVLVLLYIVMLFLYLSHKLGICRCIGQTLCKTMWACFSSCFYLLEYCCTFLCVKLQRIKRRRRRRRRRRVRNQRFYYTREEDYTDESLSYYFPSSAEIRRSFSRRRGYKGSHLRNSLRPRNHHTRVEISRNFGYKNDRSHNSEDTSYTNNFIKRGNYKGTVHDIKVTRTSKFARKGVNNRRRVIQKQRW